MRYYISLGTILLKRRQGRLERCESFSILLTQMVSNAFFPTAHLTLRALSVHINSSIFSQLSKEQGELQWKTRTCPRGAHIQQPYTLVSENYLAPATPRGGTHMAKRLIPHPSAAGKQEEYVQHRPTCRVQGETQQG